MKRMRSCEQSMSSVGLGLSLDNEGSGMRWQGKGGGRDRARLVCVGVVNMAADRAPNGGHAIPYPCTTLAQTGIHRLLPC